MSNQSVTDSSRQDPLEAIYALNIGDFVTESFISDELLSKITNRLGDDPNKLRAQLEELIQIYSMDNTLSVLGFETTEGFVLYDSVCRTLAQMFGVDACHLFQTAHNDAGKSHLSLSGTSVSLSHNKRWEIGVDTQANDALSIAAKGYDIEVLGNLKKNPHWHPISHLNQGNTTCLMAAPLNEGGRSMGLLILESYDPKQNSFTDAQHTLASESARMIVTALRLQQVVAEAREKLNQASPNPNQLLNYRAQITESIADLGIYQQSFVEALSAAIDARNEFSEGHSLCVAKVAEALSRVLGLNEKTVDLIYMAGLLGSIGKVHISKDVFSKTSKLSEGEKEELRNHPNVGVNLMGKINFLSETKPYIQSIQERWNGSGSPEGLKGNNIPVGARILGLADAYAALTHPRPYREQPLSSEEALKQLQTEAGSKWDPMLVEKLAETVSKIDLASS